MAAVAPSLALGGDRYGPPRSSSSSSTSWSSSSSSLSSSSADTTEDNSYSSWSSSSSDVSPSKKKKKSDKDKKKKKRESNKQKNTSKSTAVIQRTKSKKKKTKNTKSSLSVGRGGVDRCNDNEVGSMLLLGAELLKEVEEAAASAAANTAAAAALMDESRPAEPLPLPIGHYVVHGGPQNRSILLEQVMSSVPAAQWQAILPPVLKEMNSAELKQLCLQQLQLLSDSTILNIINGGGDQGPAGKAVWSETATLTEGEARSKKKKSKKSKKKKAKKAKKSERLDVDPVGAQAEGDEESSGKTLMELLELEMRARAIKALLKKEEEGEEEDEWSDDIVASSCDAPSAPPVENDVIQRPLKVAQESSFGDKNKHQQSNTGHRGRSSADPVPPTHYSQQSLIPAVQQRRPARLHQQTDDEELKRRGPHDNDEVLHKSRQPRNYRQRHHERSRSPVVRRTDPSGTLKTEMVKSTSSRVVEELTHVRIKSERQEEVKGVPEKGERMRPVQCGGDEEVEYEEEGIQEVDIELGSGSDDDAHSARI